MTVNALKKNVVVKIVHGKENGRAAWYVVLVDRLKLPIYQKMMQTGDYNLPSVGEVLHSGWGTEVPEPILVGVQEQYGS